MKETKKQYLKYFYNINLQTNEEEICHLEIKSLFDTTFKDKFIISDISIDPTRSRFLKSSISVIYAEKTLEDIIKRIKEDKVAYDDFKVIFVKYDNVEVEYKDRLDAVRKIGMEIIGEPSIHNPKIVLGVTKAQGEWLFGIYNQHDSSWHIHDSKPYKYSNAIGITLARSIINIAVKNNTDLKIVDPCCGIGTVVIEGLSLGLNIKGYEINKQIAANAKRNLEFFGYKDVISAFNMHDIKESFDVAIVDLPYGLFTKTTLKEQRDIIKTTSRLASRAIIITFENMDNIIKDAGFNILEKASISKGKFVRYINVCEKY